MNKTIKRNTRAVALASTAVIVAALLSACGGKGEEQVEGGIPVEEFDEDAASTEGAALKCPPRVGKDLAGPDIFGLKLGMRYDEALATARCALGGDAPVTTEKRWFDRLDTHGVELGPQAFTIKQGQQRPCNYGREWQSCDGKVKWEHMSEAVTVATPGAPGSERVMAIWRSQYFPEGQMPAVEATLEALKAKYGQPQHVDASDSPRGYDAGHRTLEWVLSPDGTPLADPNPMFGQCRNGISGKADGESRAGWREGCGLNIHATIHLHRGNPGLARELHVSMLRQDALVAHGRATEQELRSLGETRRADELRNAGGVGDVSL